MLFKRRWTAVRLLCASLALAAGAVACMPHDRPAPTDPDNTSSSMEKAPGEAAWPASPGTADFDLSNVKKWEESLAAAMENVGAFVDRRDGVVGVAAVDIPSGTSWTEGRPKARIRSASIVKLAAAAWYLRKEKRDGKWQGRKEQLDRLIRYSDDQTMYDLYDPAAQEIFALLHEYDKRAEFSPVWGWTQVTAQGQAEFLAALVDGEVLDKDDTAYLTGLMKDVVEDQRWGLAAAYERTVEDDRQRLLVKNGWYAWDTGFTSINCLAVFPGPSLDRQLAVAVTTSYPNERGYSYGEHTCHTVGRILHEALGEY